MGKIISKSTAAKRAQKGEDMGKPGKGFDAGVHDLMTKKHMTEEQAKKIMGAQFWAMRRRGQL